MMKIQDLEMIQVLNRSDRFGNATIVSIRGGDGFFEIMDSGVVTIEIALPIVDIIPILGGLSTRSGIVEGDSSSASSSFMMS